MEKRLENYKGTVAYTLNQHKDEIYAAMQNPALTAEQFRNIKQLVNTILTTDQDVRKNEAAKAIDMLNKAGNYPNRYLSTLAAYMTGIAVGK